MVMNAIFGICVYNLVMVLGRSLGCAAVCFTAFGAWAATLTVGAGKQFGRIEDANAAAQPGDRIEIYPASGSGVYLMPAVYVTKASLTFVGMLGRQVLDGSGFNYSGVGSIPRAIFQVNLGANGVTIENLELRAAHNDSHNGAGVRINQGNHMTVRSCSIHGNDMGIMSNGDGVTPTSASDQVIEYCSIYSNGDVSNPGFSHNLYLGGTSVTVQFCDIHDSTAGHNLKSRAHFNLIQYNFIHDSANRELDLVDAWDTSRANSNTALIGNLIVKQTNMAGNRGVIHFGQDGGGAHNGTIYLSNNTIVTTYISDVVQLTANPSAAVFVDNVVFNGAQNAPSLYSVPGGLPPTVVTGNHNWISKGYSILGSGIDAGTRYQGPLVSSDPGFTSLAKGNFFLAKNSPAYGVNSAPIYLDGDGVNRPAVPTFQYRAIADKLPISWAARMFIGAGLQRPVIRSGG